MSPLPSTPGDSLERSLALASSSSETLPALDPDQTTELERIRTEVPIPDTGTIEEIGQRTSLLTEFTLPKVEQWLKDQKNEIDPIVYLHVAAEISPLIFDAKIFFWKKKCAKIQEKPGDSIQEKRANLEKMEALWQERLTIGGNKSPDDDAFEARMKACESSIVSLQADIDTRTKSATDDLIGKLGKEIETIMGPEGLTGITGGGLYQQIVEQTNIMSSGQRESVLSNLDRILDAKRQEFNKKREEDEKRKNEADQIIIQDVERAFRTLKTRIHDAKDTSDLEVLKQDIQVNDLRQKIEKIKNDQKRTGKIKELDELFEEADMKIKLKPQNGKVDLGGGLELNFFTAEEARSLKWEPKYKLRDGKMDIYFEAHENGGKSDHEIAAKINPHGGVENGQVARQVYHPSYPLRITEKQFQKMIPYIGKGKKIFHLIALIRFSEALGKLHLEAEAAYQSAGIQSGDIDGKTEILIKLIDENEEYATIRRSIEASLKKGTKDKVAVLVETLSTKIKKKEEYWKEIQETLPRNEKKMDIASMGDLEKNLYLARMIEHLPTTNHRSRHRIPKIPSTAVMGPQTREFFKTFGELAEIQTSTNGEGNGIIIIEGEAGTGKNYKVNMLAALTNREVFEMSGNKTATKGDLLYSTELGPDGTYKAATELIRGIQTPGAIIVLDEVNTYPPEVLKLLNPLLAGGRYINDPQKGKIYCHPSVIICGTMNPSHYIGTTSLAQELRSRARIILDKYPEAKLPDGTTNWEEALTISKHSRELGSILNEDFITGWTEKQKSPAATWPSNMAPHKHVLEYLEKYTKFVAEIRRIYADTCTGQGNEEFHYPISLRDGIQIMYEYDRNPGAGFRKAILSVVIPKIGGKGLDGKAIEKEKTLLETKVAAFIN